MTENTRLSPLSEMALLQEIVTQVRIAEIAADHLANTSDALQIWGSIQSIVVAAANVSKILWPARKQRRARGKYLRDLLAIEENNPLSDRSFRNHFEHYDERIEEWVESNNSAVYIDSMIDPFERTPLSLPQFVHRSYNPTSKMLYFRGESVDLAALLAELAEIRRKCGRFTLPL